MKHELTNLWEEDNDINIVKTWLVGTTDGGIYPLSDWFGKKINAGPEYAVADNVLGSVLWDDCIGPCPYLKLDSPELEEKAREIADNLNKLVDKINTHPELYGLDLGYDARALKYAERVGIYVYKVNGHLMEYWSYYGSEGWYFVRYDLDKGKEVFRGANIPWDKTLGVPEFLMTADGTVLYNYMQG